MGGARDTNASKKFPPFCLPSEMPNQKKKGWGWWHLWALGCEYSQNGPKYNHYSVILVKNMKLKVDLLVLS